MPLPGIAFSNPFLEFVSKGDNPLKILITETLNRCYLCGHESKSLFILTFNKLACQVCFDFVLSCNFFNDTIPLDLNSDSNSSQNEYFGQFIFSSDSNKKTNGY
jgi:hypothetical protein